MTNWKFRTAGWVIFGVLSGAPLAQAATASDMEAAAREAEIIQRRQNDLLLEDQRRARRPESGVNGADLRMPEPTFSQPTGDCRNIDEIVIDGAALLRSRVVEDIRQRFSRQCLGVSEIEQILGLITRDYIERGYVTARAYLPKQDLTSGRLRIFVIEGVIEGYRPEGPGTEKLRLPLVFPGAPGEVLNLRDLEQGVDQLNRLSSNQASMDIVPGSETGKSIVIVRNQATLPWHLTVGYDTMGSKSTGKESLSANVVADNPLGFNERWTVTQRNSLPGQGGHQSDSSSLDFWLPLGNYSFGINTSRSHYMNDLTLPSGLVMRSTGDTETTTATLDKVAYRDQASRINLGASLSTSESLNYLAGQLLTVSSRRLTTLDLHVSGSTFWAGSMINGQLGYVRGLKLFHALEDPANPGADAPRAQFVKYTVDFGFMKPFQLGGRDFSWSTQASGQYTNTPLYGSQQMLIGSTSSVRGFTLNSLNGDDGYYVRNELSMPGELTLANEHIRGRLYVGYDMGRVSGLATGSASGALSGATLGLSAQWRGANMDWFVSKPLDQPGTFSRESAQVWFRLSFSL